jgi:predicted ribosomally synthesized peptide with SipW-like signal peptide
MKTRLIIALALVAVMAFGISIGTYAWFSSQSAPQIGQITTGTLNLSVDKTDLNSEDIATFDFNFENAQPGDTFAPIDITITNTGSLDLMAFKHFALTKNEAGLAKAIVLTEFLVEDWSTEEGPCNVLDSKGAWGAAFDGDDSNLSLYDLCNSLPDNMGPGWTGTILKEGETQRIQMTFKLDGELAVNSMQGKTAGANLTVYGTQAKEDAVIASLEGKPNVSTSQAALVFKSQVNQVH